MERNASKGSEPPRLMSKRLYMRKGTMWRGDGLYDYLQWNDQEWIPGRYPYMEKQRGLPPWYCRALANLKLALFVP